MIECFWFFSKQIDPTMIQTFIPWIRAMFFRAKFLVVIIIFAFNCSTPTLAFPPQSIADLIIINAKIWTPSIETQQAIAIRSDSIIAVGSNALIESLIGPTTIRIDARGGTVTPGLNDAHVHFLSGSLSMGQVDLTEVETLIEIESRIRAFVAIHRDETCIVGRGWLYGAFPGGMPTKEQLDHLVSDRPAIMKCYDGHTVWVNSKALKLAGISRASVDPPNGIIVRDPSTGEPTGALKEAAMELLDKLIPTPSTEEKLLALKRGIAESHRFGITSVQEAGMKAADIELIEMLRVNQELKLRMNVALEAKPWMSEQDADQLEVIRKRFPQIPIRSVKFYADGVIESHTAAVLQPYSNNPSQGLMEYSEADFDRIVAMLDARGWQIMIHAIGDAGIRMSLNAIERAVKLNPSPERERRHRIEHIESINREDIPRFGQLGVIASMQPYHASPNSNIFNVWAVNLGPDRASRAWCWKSIQDAGGKLAFGSDWPVVGLDPSLGMHTALTRQTLQGEPSGGFIPEQRLPLESVLDAYTRGSAFAESAEDKKGTLAVGMLADVVVWDRDLFSLPVQQVHTAKVRTTIMDGRVVFQTGE